MVRNAQSEQGLNLYRGIEKKKMEVLSLPRKGLIADACEKWRTLELTNTAVTNGGAWRGEARRCAGEILMMTAF